LWEIPHNLGAIVRRIFVSCCLVLLLLFAVSLTYFSFSSFLVKGQPVWRSLSDFGYLLKNNRFGTVASPPPFSQTAYRTLLERIGPKTHDEIRTLVLRQITQWGADVEPLLIADIETLHDPAQQAAVARILGELKSVPGGLVIAELLQKERLVAVYGLHRELIRAVGESGAEAAVPLLRKYYADHPENRSEIFNALGRLGAVDLLLEEFQRESDWERKDDLIWPLAETRAPRAMRVLAPLLLDFEHGVRVRTISALSQSAGAAAIDACLDLLKQTRNEYIYGVVIQSLLANRFAAGNPRVVPFLQQYLQYPPLASEANYALARIGSPDAVAALATLIGKAEPAEVMRHFEYLGSDALPLLSVYFQDEDPYIRRQAIAKLDELLAPAALPLLQTLTNDPDYWVRQAAVESIGKLEKLQLFKSFTDSLPENIGRTAWRGFRWELTWGLREGFAYGIHIFTGLHWCGIWLSLVLGLLLLFNLLRVFEPYRFNLFIQFLLISGFLGDFLLLENHPSDFGQPYLFATGCHLLLLIGFFSKENKPLPGQLGNRFVRLGGLNMLLLAPVLVWFGTPVLALALRRQMTDFSFVWPGLVILLVTSLLVIEQWALPWKMLRRSARQQRLLSVLISTAVLGWVAWSPLMAVQDASSNPDMGTINLLILLPFVWLLSRHWLTLHPFRRQRKILLPPAPNPTWQVNCDGERIGLFWQPEATGWRKPVLNLLLVSGSGLTAAALAGLYRGGGPGFVLSLLVGLFGAAIVGLLMEFFRKRLQFQIEDGYLRCGFLRLGGTLGASSWSRHLLMAGLSPKQRLKRGQKFTLKPEDIAWLKKLRAISQGTDSAKQFSVNLAAKAHLAWSTALVEPLLLMQLTLKNCGDQPLSLLQIDQLSGRPNWSATLAGQPTELMFYRQQREQLINPGEVKSLQLRIFPRGGDTEYAEPSHLELVGPAGLQLKLPVPGREVTA
jgi:HEAT repeat protein